MVGDIEVGEGDMINVTGIVLVCQVPTLIVMVALYVPAPLPLVLTATVSCVFWVMVVLVGDTDNQVALSESVSVAVLELVFETLIICFGGLVAPCTA